LKKEEFDGTTQTAKMLGKDGVRPASNSKKGGRKKTATKRPWGRTEQVLRKPAKKRVLPN